ncbi:MAG: threonine/serine dehydratase [Bacteroidia bacterium]|nr:threonine/serine dehydratase [Bacteroidia bacterium]
MIEAVYEKILQAKSRIKDQVFHTPMIKSHWLTNIGNADVYLKLENEQITGSFKARGSLNKVLNLPEIQDRLLVTASTGNHAQGMARAFLLSKKKGIIFLPENADRGKVHALQNYQADLRFYGTDCLQTELHAKSWAFENNAEYVSPYNDIDIIAGQGTIGIEILEQLPLMDCVFVTIGGGGLASGIATYLKTKNPKIKIIGCLPENSPEMYLSVQAGEVVYLEHPKETLSDGSAGGLEKGSVTFEICEELIDQFVLVSEEEIATNIRETLKFHHKIIEGSAAVAIAAYRKLKNELSAKKVGIVICGGNIGYEKLKSVICI